jgi:transketolase
MRRKFQEVVSKLIENDPSTVLLLGDIGVFGFRNQMAEHPERVINVGILEQAMTGIAAGLSKASLNPIIHSIAPFVVERTFEQLKIDFGYQNLRGNLISVGASVDYAALGATHHCPGDISLLLSIPNIEIFVPGTITELDYLLRESLQNNKFSYFRLTENPAAGQESANLKNGSILREGRDLTIIAFGPFIQEALEIGEELNAQVIYFNKMAPFDGQILLEIQHFEKVVLLEPFYEGTMIHQVIPFIKRPAQFLSIGFPREFIHTYGKYADQVAHLGLTKSGILERVRSEFND